MKEGEMVYRIYIPGSMTINTIKSLSLHGLYFIQESWKKLLFISCHFECFLKQN